MSTSYIIHTNAHYLQDQMTGRPSSPVLTEILDLPGSSPDEGEAQQKETEGRGEVDEVKHRRKNGENTVINILIYLHLTG